MAENSQKSEHADSSKRLNPDKSLSPNKTLIAKQLFDELPKIASKDFLGKDVCPKCSKIVKESHQAISCDGCDRWTHRKCCQIKIKKYKRLCTEKFSWLCHNCRSDDDLTDELLNIEFLDPNELPDDYEMAKKLGNKELLIIHINCRSILNKSEELQLIIDMINPDIICLTETWLDASVPPNSHIPTGYKIIRKDRSPDFQQKYKKNRGGGVAILYRSHLTVVTKEKLCDSTEEMLWVQVRGKETFLLCVIYRPDYSDLLNPQNQINADVLNDDTGESQIEKNIRKATETSKNIIVLGDFNIDMKNYENYNTQNLKNIFKSYSLTQKIAKPTRFNYNTGKSTLIDHFWCTPEIKVKSTGTIMGISDHLGIYAKINMSSNNASPQYIKRRNFKTYDPTKYSAEVAQNLEMSDIQSHIENKDINSATDALTNILLKAADKHAPLKSIKIKEKSRIPWTTSALTDMIAEKNKLLSANTVLRSKLLKRKINKTQSRIKKLKQSLKMDFTKNEIEKADKDPQKLWYLYNLLTQRGNQKELLEPQPMSQQAANKHNHFFSTIGVSNRNTPDETLPQQTGSKKAKTKFSLKEETPNTIEKIIDNLKNNVAVGRDNLNVRFIKDAKKEISPLLTSIINLGYQLCVFPDSMKVSRIKPIYKKDNPNQIENYRPIALLPILSKIFERCVANQIISYLEENQLLSRTQHAYRKLHSPITCLAELLNHIYKKLDSNFFTAIVSVDLSKAFDSINHKILLKKLKNFGFENSAIQWISSYLTNRRQTTQFKRFESKEEITTAGVPQGSILGPLLFICYTNDLSHGFNELCSIFSYADDTQFVANADTLSELKTKIKLIMDTAQTWFFQNHLHTNPTKTKILIFHHNDKDNPITFDVQEDGVIKQVSPKSFVKILGVYVDKDLNWVKHINFVKKKSMNVTRNIHRINYLLPIQHRINLYHGLISPQFDYADVAWGGCAEKDKKRLQTVQNFAAKSITGNKKQDSASQSLNKLNFLNLAQRRHIHETVFAHKAILGKSTANLCEKYNSLLPTHNTRRSTLGKLNLPSHSTSKFKKSPLYRSIISWNNTPSNLPKDNIKSHKNQYQK